MADSSDMHPTLPMRNPVYGRLPDPVVVGDTPLDVARCDSLSNCSDLIFGQFRGPTSRTPLQSAFGFGIQGVVLRRTLPQVPPANAHKPVDFVCADLIVPDAHRYVAGVTRLHARAQRTAKGLFESESVRRDRLVGPGPVSTGVEISVAVTIRGARPQPASVRCRRSIDSPSESFGITTTVMNGHRRLQSFGVQGRACRKHPAPTSYAARKARAWE